MKQSQSLRNMKKNLGSTQQLALVLFSILLVVGAVAYFYFNYTNRGVSVEIKLPEEQILAGEIFDVDVVVSNRSQEPLRNVRTTLTLPNRVRLIEHEDRVNEVRELEDMSMGTSIKETYKLVALPGGENGDYALEAKVNYSTDTFSSQFESKSREVVDVSVEEFELEFELPGDVVTGEEFPVEVRYKLPESERESLDKYLVFEGESLSTLDSSHEPVGQNKWLLEEGEDKSISASMLVSTKETDVFVLVTKIVVELGGEEYSVLEQRDELLLAGSSLSLSVSLDDPKEFVNPGELLGYRISYKNNTGIELQNAVVRVEMTGEMFDFSSISTSGTVDSVARIITWSPNRIDELRSLSKGEEGTFTISIKVKPTFPIDNVNDKNFILRTRASIESPTVPQGANTDRTSNFSNLELNVAGSLRVDAVGYFRDAASGILNEGPFPPKVNIPTEYTIHWALVNFGTDVENVIVRARLEDGVDFTGETKSNTDTVPYFDTANREVVWQVGNIAATQGVIGEKPEAVFQVSLAPSGSLFGEFAPLLGITSVSGRDAFAAVDLSGTDVGLTTRLNGDPTVGPNEGRVIQ